MAEGMPDAASRAQKPELESRYGCVSADKAPRGGLFGAGNWSNAGECEDSPAMCLKRRRTDYHVDYHIEITLLFY